MRKKIIIINVILLLGGGILLPFHFLSAIDQLTPIIIVPGVGASLNWQTFTDHGNNSWDFAPSVNDYKTLIQTLEARGYVLNQNLFIAHYDWRQSNLLSATQYLKPVIDKAILINRTNDVYVIAHSMGGLVTRSYVEYNNDTRIASFIMLGTPNYGSGDTYTLWENGTLPVGYTGKRAYAILFYLWYLTASQKLFGDNFTAVQQNVQSAKELLPTYDYLKNAETDEIIPYATHKRKANTLSRNSFLESLNDPWSMQKMIDRIFNTHIIAGTGEQTLKYIPVAPDNDTNNAQWTDGVPLPNPPLKDTDEGDGTVLLESALIKNLDIHKRIVLVQSWWRKALSLFIPHPSLSFLRRGNDDASGHHPNPLPNPPAGGLGQALVKERGIDVAYAQEDDEGYTHEEYIQNCINRGKTREECEQQLENYFLSSSYPIKLHTIASTHGDLPTTAIPKIFEILGLGAVPEIPAQPSPIQRLLQVWIGSPVAVDITAPDGTPMNEIENIEIATSGRDDPIQIISIPEPEQGEYTVTLTGTGTGEYHLAASLISDTEQTLTTKNGTTAPSLQTTYTVTIPEQPAEPTQNQNLFEQEPTTDYTLSLSQGWNLISIPSFISDSSPESFFEENIQSIDSIWSYDALQENPWHTYYPNRPELNSLTTLSPGYGYWIKWTLQEPLTLTKQIAPLEQGPMTPPSRTLTNGWNLIGPYHLFNTRSGAFETAFQTLTLNNTPLWKSILGYNNDRKIFQRFSDDDFDDAGNGYWLFVQNKKGSSVFAP
ncbi:MAG: hypothetical protein A3H59_01500 [Candidatus Jacksonbacteria bacterium RIFCSPLOWO2_02_FULL_43_9]|nr:MAG: hypothetical protein A3H59_01500 [Candidatus Jacksonbacteria bacterium RIFCSPLOWO2_02_FULL_43_9]